MSEPTNVDTGSLIVSYLWQITGHAALKHALILGLAASHERTEAQVIAAARELSTTGWLDLAHEEGMPCARLTPEAIQALTEHVQSGAALPEKLEREAERKARLERQLTEATVMQAELLREVRDDTRAAREAAQEGRRLLEDLRREHRLPGPPPQVMALPPPRT